MNASVNTIERRARYLMSIVSAVLLLALVAWDAGWVRAEQAYKDTSWYLVNEHAGFVVTSEYQDESACLREEKTSGTCRSGKALIADQARNATSIERS